MRDGSKTRQKIHQAALSLFVAKGVSQTTVRDISGAAGVAEGTLYRHYASMADLVADLFTTNYGAFAGHLDLIQRRQSTFRAKLEAIVIEVCRFYDDDPTLFRFLLLVQHQALPRVEEGPGNPVSVLHAMIKTAIDRHEITLDDPALATSMVLGLILQPATGLVYGRHQPPFSAFAPQIAAACWRALNP